MNHTWTKRAGRKCARCGAVRRVVGGVSLYPYDASKEFAYDPRVYWGTKRPDCFKPYVAPPPFIGPALPPKPLTPAEKLYGQGSWAAMVIDRWGGQFTPVEPSPIHGFMMTADTVFTNGPQPGSPDS